MSYSEMLAWQTEELLKCIIIVYHLPTAQAEQQLKASTFYKLLADEHNGWWRDSVDKNFRRYQNEVEYGAWNKDEHGDVLS
ncbi:MAG: hypothetical protein J6M20_04265 [Clostridia bacterium]|nr:hypothetical protein [Clostridia bacterium]